MAQVGAVIDEDVVDDTMEKLDSTGDDGASDNIDDVIEELDSTVDDSASDEIDDEIDEDVGRSEEIHNKIEADEGIDETTDEDASIEELDGTLGEDPELGMVTSDDRTLTRVDCCGRTMAESAEEGLLARTLLVANASLLENLYIMTDPRVLVNATPNPLEEIGIIRRLELDGLPDTEGTSTGADCCGNTTVGSEEA
jgi:hypothetical protein